MDNKNARIKFEAAPATEIRAESLLMLRRLNGSKGVGLPQPTPTIKRARVPRGSKCEAGFNVSLPANLAVGSPSRHATYAWANSWMVIAETRPVIKAKAMTGLLWSRVRISMVGYQVVG